MKKGLLAALLVFSFLIVPFSAEALVGVKGYYRKDGTYVRPHYRTNPDSYTYNNFSANGYRTTDVSRSTAQSWENSLNSKPRVPSNLSKREKKVYNCQLQGNSAAYCKSLHMKKK